MKKMLLVLFSTALLFGCSSDDDVSDSKTSFNPPSWIQGRWLEETIGTSGYKFTNNDFILVVATTEYSIGEQIKTLSKTEMEVNVNEEIKSDTEYKFSYTFHSVTQHYHFVKLSNTKFKDVLNDPNGHNPYTKK